MYRLSRRKLLPTKEQLQHELMVLDGQYEAAKCEGDSIAGLHIIRQSLKYVKELRELERIK